MNSLTNERFQANRALLTTSRSKFDLSYEWTSDFVAGWVVPIYFEEILPGDSINYGESLNFRGSTPVTPVMGDLYLDLSYFFVSNKRLLSRASMSPSVNDSNHSWAAFIGAQDSLLNMPLPAEVKIPTFDFFQSPTDSTNLHTLGDFYGIPFVRSQSSVGGQVSALPFLAYFDIWNNFFRDPNTQNPATFSITNGAVTLQAMGNTYTNVNRMPVLNSCAMHGYFGSALPWPQRSQMPVTIPLGGIAELGAISGDSLVPGSYVYTPDGSDGLEAGDVMLEASRTSPVSSGAKIGVDLSNVAATSVSTFRLAVQTQRWFEALARGGNRLGEITASMFGVTPHDAVDDGPIYLGGKRLLISNDQVVATSNTTGTDVESSLGGTGGFMHQNDYQPYLWNKSFDTWGCIIGLATVRVKDQFTQGLDRRFTRFDRFSYYWPQFAHLGEQPILNKELFVSGSSVDEEVFGYQEYGADYRFHNDIVCGAFRDPSSSNLRAWTYANYFATTPTLPAFINGYRFANNVDQTLSVPSSVSKFQFFMSIKHHVTAVRPLPTYSIPGLVDHN